MPPASSSSHNCNLFPLQAQLGHPSLRSQDPCSQLHASPSRSRSQLQLDFADCNRSAAKGPALHLTYHPRDWAHNCSLILRIAIALQPRARKILGVRALRAAFRISQDPSSPSHASPARLRSQLPESAKIPALHHHTYPFKAAIGTADQAAVVSAVSRGMLWVD
jgi:hypothetical protein